MEHREQDYSHPMKDLSNQPGMLAKAEREPEIPNTLDVLDKKIDHLADTAMRLENALHVICRPIPENPGRIETEELRTALGQRLNNFINRVSHLDESLTALIDSLEL